MSELSLWYERKLHQQEKKVAPTAAPVTKPTTVEAVMKTNIVKHDWTISILAISAVIFGAILVFGILFRG